MAPLRRTLRCCVEAAFPPEVAFATLNVCLSGVFVPRQGVLVCVCGVANQLRTVAGGLLARSAPDLAHNFQSVAEQKKRNKEIKLSV